MVLKVFYITLLLLVFESQLFAKLRLTEEEKFEKENTIPMGSYRFKLGANKPTFKDPDGDFGSYYKLKGMWMPTIGSDFHPLSWGPLAFGLALKTGFYRVEGQTSLSKDRFIDSGSRSQFTLLPLQTGLSLNFSPFVGRWLGIQAWGGYEFLYYQEERTETGSSNTATTTTTSSTTDSTAPLVNKGFKNMVFYGVQLDLCLNFLDQASVKSLENILGFKFIFLSPYYEVSQTKTLNGLDLSRKSIGVMFTFESAK